MGYYGTSTKKGSPLKYNHIITTQISTGNSNGTTVPKTMARVLLSVYYHLHMTARGNSNGVSRSF